MVCKFIATYRLWLHLELGRINACYYELFSSFYLAGILKNIYVFGHLCSHSTTEIRPTTFTWCVSEVCGLFLHAGNRQAHWIVQTESVRVIVHVKGERSSRMWHIRGETSACRLASLRFPVKMTVICGRGFYHSARILRSTENEFISCGICR